MEELTWLGNEIAKEAEEMGTDDGFLNFTLEEIRSENYIVNTINIEDLVSNDENFKEFLDSQPEIREFEGECFSMDPIVSSEGKVLDGWNRINQLTQDGITKIRVLQGVKVV